MNLSHRLRLAFFAASVTGLVLAAVFTTIVHFARASALGTKRAELSMALAAFTPLEDERFDISEFHEAHPELSASVFDGAGRFVRSAGRLYPRRIQGFEIIGNQMVAGTRFKGEDVALAADLTETVRGLDELETVLGAIWLPLAFLIGASTWLATQAVFRPLERLSAQALAMSGADLSERLDSQDRAEFGAFATRLNGMLCRIEETARRGERFSDDAAHELRTPLAILRTRLETALLQPRSPEEYEATIRRSVGEISRITSITESLLRSARGEAESAEVIDLRPLVQETALRWEERFASRRVVLDLVSGPAAASILPDELRVVLDNLLDNALRYSPAESRTTLRVATFGDEVRLSVSDQGPGVPPELGERVFDRFVRADDSRNRASGGAGIGLAVCRQIVSGRGGRMFLAQSGQEGAEVGCLLPCSNPT